MNEAGRAASTAQRWGRRRFLGLGAAGATGLLLAACGGEEPPTGSSAADGSGGAKGAAKNASGPWTYTDDRGKRISLPRRPERIVAQSAAAAALWDFGVRPVAVFGPHRLKNGEPDPEVGRVDISKVESIGNVWDEFNIEKYASVRPDLLVSGMYVKNTLWYVPEKSKQTIEAMAPTVGVMLTGRKAEKTIETYAKLAESLGADLDAPEVAKAKRRFEKATARLEEFGKANPDLKVMAVGATPELFYVSYHPDMPDLDFFKDHGINIVVPDKPDETGFYESLSWENADKYDADVILVDARAQSMKVSEMEAKPTWRRLPAVRAGQVYPWRAETRYSYLGYAIMLEELITNLEKSRRL